MDSDSHQLQQRQQHQQHQQHQLQHQQHHQLLQHQQHHQQLQHQHHQHQQHVMISTANSYTIPTNTNTHTATTVTTTAPSMPMMMPQQHHQIQQIQASSQNPNSNSDRFPYNSMVNSGSASQQTMEYSDGSPRAAGSGSGFTIEPARKKRGRPRKYSPDGNIGLALSPPPVTPGGGSQVDYSGGSGGGTTPSSEPSGKRRGRPPGSGKKQLDALGGTTGVGFTPHVITVESGKDIAAKLMEFAQEGPRTVCILSANGAICNVTLRQSALAGGTVAYEGRFEIVSLTGTFNRQRPVELNVSLAGSDGRVLGGGVVGSLMAASTIQVVVGSFIADGKKPKSGPSSGAPPLNMMNFGAPPPTGNSPPSQDASSDSSDENDEHPFNRGPGGPYGNVTQPLQNAPPMYSNMGWPSSIKMHPN